VPHVDVEHPLEHPCPTAAARAGLGLLGLALGDRWIIGRALRHHHRPQLGGRGQHAMEPDQVQPRHQRRQPLHELQRAQD
jgi:hypothetical protein